MEDGIFDYGMLEDFEPLRELGVYLLGTVELGEISTEVLELFAKMLLLKSGVDLHILDYNEFSG